jgi:hypothetical protein
VFLPQLAFAQDTFKSMLLIAGERKVTVSDDCEELKRKLRRNITQQQDLDKKIKD